MPLAHIQNYLIKNKESFVNSLVDDIVIAMGIEIPITEIDRAKVMYMQFIEFLATSINNEDTAAPEELISWSRENGDIAAAENQNISDIFVRYPDTRIVFSDYFLKIGVENKLSMENYALLMKRVNHMLDLSINETIFAFERQSNKNIQDAKDIINELAFPVVPIQNGLAILPLIGSIDADRVELLLNKVTPYLVNEEIESLIIDFSGMVTIDAYVAKYIFKIYNVLSLLGINVIFTGISPASAREIINNGINFSNLNIHTNVQQAIESINKVD